MNKKLGSLIIASIFALAASLSTGAGIVHAAGPTMTNKPATAIGQNSATLNAHFNSGTTAATNVRFEYNTSSSFDISTSSFTGYQTFYETSGDFSAPISGLNPNTTYYYRAIGITTGMGTGYSSTFNFNTLATAVPVVNTVPAVVGIGGAVTLKGYYSSTDAVSTWFQYATNPSLTGALTTTPVGHSAGSGNFSETITLSPNTKYWYRAVAQRNPGGTTVYATSTMSFTTGASTGAGCTIDDFDASNYTVSSGSTVILSWTTVGCSTGSINTIGTVTPISYGSVTTGPLTSTTTFTLTASGGGQVDNDTVTVVVTGSSNSSCNLSSFYPGSSTISSGQSTYLYWNVNSACTVSISPATGGSVSSGATSYNTGALFSTTNYTITASGLGTPQTLSTTVTVNGGSTSSCQINYFTASPSTVAYGQSANLSWGSTGCTYANISNIGSISTNGSTSTPPLYATTTYTLTVGDSNGDRGATQVVVAVTQSGTTGWGTTTGTGYCQISSFTASPTTISSGQSAMLSWNAPGCSSTTLSGGPIYTRYEPAYGSESTGPLYGTTTFTLYGNGGTSSAQSVTVYVTNSPYPYSYTCGYGSYDANCQGQYANTIITTPATNVGSSTTRLNGIANNINASFAAYFEYGTTPSLGQATGFQNTFPVTSYNFYDTIRVAPSTTYYYRAVAQINGTIVRGNILSFKSASAAANIVYVTESSSNSTSTRTSTTSTNSTANASGILVTVINQKEKFNVGDTVEYTVTYENKSGKTLSNGVLTIVMPLGFTVKSTTQGIMQPPSTVIVNLGTIAPNQTGSIYMQAEVQPNVATDQTLVTNATLAYMLANNVHDSAVGYVLNHAQVQNVFAGFALGSGFFPSTIWGWFLTFIIILIIILISRRIIRAKSGHDDHGHGGGHGGHGGGHDSHDTHGHAPAKH